MAGRHTRDGGRHAATGNGTGARGRPLAIVGARLIDGTGADPVEQGTLVIEGEHISAVGPRARVTVPRDARVIEADGASILPGLIDCHVHLTGDWLYPMRHLMTPPSLQLLHCVPNCRATLEAGITTVRDAGGTPAAVKLAVERGFFAGPRMQVAVSFLSQTGGHGDHLMPCCVDLGRPLPADVPYGVVDGVDQMRKVSREVLRAGADWLKLCTSGGVLSAADAPTSPQFTVEEIAVAVYEASTQNKRCMAHAQSTQGIKNALRAGIASIEHGIWLDDEAIAFMVKHGIYLVPTLKAPEDVVRAAEAHPELLPSYAIEKSLAVMADHRASFRRAVAAGVKVAMGTDTGVGPHGENARELALMVAHGMTPMQAIVASTLTAAELLRVEEHVGTLAVGKLADVLLVNGDPLARVELVAEPEQRALVLKGGMPVSGSLLAASELRQSATLVGR